MRTYRLKEVVETYEIREEFVTHCIYSRWLRPVEHEKQEVELDQEDLARLLFIHELQTDLGVNDEAMPIILHLLDQLHFIRNRLPDRRDSSEAGAHLVERKVGS